MAKQNEELLAMARLDRELQKLAPEVRRRVLAWLVERHREPTRDELLGCKEKTAGA